MLILIESISKWVSLLEPSTSSELYAMETLIQDFCIFHVEKNFQTDFGVGVVQLFGTFIYVAAGGRNFILL